MNDTISEMLVAAMNKPDSNPFLFEVGQTVRVVKRVIDDGQTPEHWSGAMGTVISQRCTMLSKRHWYKVKHAGRNCTCDFEEDELDFRFAKRK